MSKKRYVLLSRILEQISDMEYESLLLHEEMNPGVSDVLEHWETVIPFEIPVELDEEAAAVLGVDERGGVALLGRERLGAGGVCLAERLRHLPRSLRPTIKNQM